MSVDVPIRTCIGCRGRAPRFDLLRVVVVEGQLAPDPTATRPGRGAWLHRDLECLAQADRRRAFSRALPLSRALDVEPVRVEIEATSKATDQQGDRPARQSITKAATK